MANLLKRLVAVHLLLLCTGCETVRGWLGESSEDTRAPAELLDIVEETRIKSLWSVSVGNGQGNGFYRLQPVLDGDRLYAAGSDGIVMVVESETGKRVWRVDLEQEISGGVGIGGDMVLIGSSDGSVIALSDQDGSPLWTSQLQGEILAAPQTNGRVVVVQSYDGRLHGLDAADGSQLWSYDSNLPVLTLRGTSTPIIYERFAIAAFGNGRVVALDVNTGAVRWEARVAIAQGRSEIDRIVDIDGNMLLMPPVLWAVSYQGSLAAIEVASGRKLRQEDVSSYAGLDQGFGNIYATEESGTVIAFLRNSGGVRWEQGDLSFRQLSSPRAIKGYVAVADFQGYVHLLSQVDGRIVGRTRTDGDGVRADMLARDDVLYVFGNSGKLTALRVSARDTK